MHIASQFKMQQNQLIDRFGREHHYLRISLNDNCNFACRYCVDDAPLKTQASAWMHADEIFEIAKVFVTLGIRKIRLTGGEPLVRKDFDQIIQKLAQLPVEMALSTNAYFLEKHLANIQSAGIRKLNISLDTLNPKRFQQLSGVDAFNQVWNAIQLALQQSFEIKLNCVIMRDINDDEVIDLIQLTQHHKLRIRFIEFMPFADNHWDKNKVVKSEELLQRIASVYPIIALSNEIHATDKAYSVEGFNGSFGFISTISEPFCESCNRLRITADGKMKNCLFDANEISLVEVIRQGKNLTEAIQQSIQKKAAQHGGQLLNENTINRQMLRIGG